MLDRVKGEVYWGNGLLTSFELGSMASEAFRRAPLASWISLILDPPLPILADQPIFLSKTVIRCAQTV